MKRKDTVCHLLDPSPYRLDSRAVPENPALEAAWEALWERKYAKRWHIGSAGYTLRDDDAAQDQLRADASHTKTE